MKRTIPVRYGGIRWVDGEDNDRIGVGFRIIPNTNNIALMVSVEDSSKQSCGNGVSKVISLPEREKAFGIECGKYYVKFSIGLFYRLKDQIWVTIRTNE